jgi:hydroxymethylglutaryl-CoA reductase
VSIAWGECPNFEELVMQGQSRIPGFYKLSVDERRSQLCERVGVDIAELSRTLDHGGLDPASADKVVENVIGVYVLPFGVVLNLRLNGKDRIAPMVVEEPSVIAAASNAARIVRPCGGFQAEILSGHMTAQVQLYDVTDPLGAVRRLRENEARLLKLGGDAVPNLIARGGGPRALEVRDLEDGFLVIHIHVDCGDAMGANLVNSVAEAVGPEMARLAEGRLGLRILSNLCDHRRVRVRCWAKADDLAHRRDASSQDDDDIPGDEIIDAIVRASEFAERDPYRAATHNKGIMNGIDSVALATGNDYRAVEAGAHAFAARSGQYMPLAIWRREDDRLFGELELPLALGIVGGTLRVHPVARLALKLAHAKSANDLIMLAASVGLASNLAALRALASVGIQRGHMALHARSVAIAAGARHDQVERVAVALTNAGAITVESARRVLEELNGG